MPSTSVHLPAAVLKALDRVAKQRGVSRNRLITEACRSLVGGGHRAWPERYLEAEDLPARDVALLRSTFGEWTESVTAARRSKKAPPF